MKLPQILAAESRLASRNHVRALNERERIITAIGEAQDAHQLHYFSNVRIPRLPLSEAMLADLQQRVRDRFATLNAQAITAGYLKPRWAESPPLIHQPL